MAGGLNYTDIKSLRIGAYDVKVEWLEPSTAEDLEVCGKYESSREVIQIKKGMQQWKTVDTLLHEICHAIIYQHSAGTPKKEVEEYYVSIIGNGLSQVFRDNPKLKEYL